MEPHDLNRFLLDLESEGIINILLKKIKEKETLKKDREEIVKIINEIRFNQRKTEVNKNGKSD